MWGDIETIRLLDELAANAWPAPIQQQIEGWKLRAANGITRRANSVYTSASLPKHNRWPDEAEGFYRRLGQPVRYQISDCTPPELTILLDHRGYSREADTAVQTAAAAHVAERCPAPTDLRLETFAWLEDDWLDHFLQIEGHHPGKRETYAAIMSAIGPRTLFVQAWLGGQVAGIGMGVSERGWTGLFNVATAAHARGRGVASSIMGTIAHWSLAQGSENLYLQVMQANDAANTLYLKLGFTQLYGYHYRTEAG